MVSLKQLIGQIVMLTTLGALLGLVTNVRLDKEDTSGGEMEEAGGGGRLEEWLYRQRAYPLDEIPNGAGERMLEQLDKLESGSGAMLQRTISGANNPFWLPLGPEPIISGQTFGFPRNNVSGRISALAIDPRYDGVT
ncbi:MAG: hypothetical protein EBU88_14435, partial [Acidobacteria bacterium]|nr:hypothetical protein [Acidobacteriota bacterium]